MQPLVGSPEAEIREHDSESVAKRTIQTPLTMKLENNGGGDPVYIGLAVPGTATSTAGWQIRKLTYSGSDVTSIDFADGVSTFSKVWDDRASYSY